MKRRTASSLVAASAVAFSMFGAGAVAAYTTAQTESLDHLQASLTFQIEIPGIGVVQSHAVAPILILRSEWELNPGTGLQEMATEIVSVETDSIDPVVGEIVLKAGSDLGLPASNGKIVAEFQEMYFPAISAFDLFIEVEFPELALGPWTNSAPLPISARISAYPPYGTLYALNIGAGASVPLYDGGGAIRAQVREALLVFVPEPSTALLLSAGLAGLAASRRRGEHRAGHRSRCLLRRSARVRATPR